MYYVLLDSTGNMVASYRDEGQARLALEQLVSDDPGAADDVALMTYEEDGELAAEPIFAAVTYASATVHVDSISEWYAGQQADIGSGQATTQIQIAEAVGG